MNTHTDWMTNNLTVVQSAKQRYELQKTTSEGTTDKIDGTEETFIVQNHTNILNKYDNSKYIHCDLTSIAHWGSVVEYKSEKYLITTDLLNNEAYKSAIMKKCNSTLTLITSVTKEKTGTDSLGRPIYTETPKSTSWDCIAETKIINADFDKAINLPEGKIFITIPYSTLILENMEFSMWGNKYKITGFNMEKVIGGVGIMGVHAERKV